ncbi:MAG: TOMM precursor leader peptide-binding protein [Gammaproteobacteria bacterium]|nr:TOMM precursor leader peptide-binding protein [Gammaproteobacteria bacterium]MXY89130.1 TOMM precursor leader peptide-binding protein [Gammaproteobacteria bacterium]MYA35206.1 TOMM precursor leader peptide-binding protein [Gammaproteobacteria bacterium]MYE28559.1 TOMM precursor leader peptide-binding protein [Gammaproteobacteria bacterium]MYG95726.1 TOMM precursor leader peptide-binding protein [Gammaproteobacteria bacterium]
MKKAGSGSGILRRITSADQGPVEFPALAPHLCFHVIGEQQTLLVSETFNTLLHGALYCDLLPLLDGRRAQGEIVAALEDRHAATEILAALVSLSARGYVLSGEHGMDRERAAYWSSLGASPRWVEQRLAESRIEVVDDDGGLTRRLEESGARTGSEDPELSVIVCGDYLEERLSEVNRRRLESGKPWMLVRPRGMQPLFGPVFYANREGPCWACLGYRLRAHQEVHNFLRNLGGEEAAFKPFAEESAVVDALYGLIAAEILKWVVLADAAPIHEHALTINTGRFESSRHQVLRRPQCPECGDEALYRPDRSPVPLKLEASPKAVCNSGGSRTVAPEVTLAKYRHLVSPVSGVVTWLERTTDETDSWLHVYWAGSNLGMRSRKLSSLRRSLRSKSAGKGSTREQSEVSALCEAVERYSGALHGEEIRVRKRFSDFADSEAAIHPNEVQLFSESQLDNAADINAKGHPYNVVPPRLDPDAKIDWSPVWSLSRQAHCYLPTSMLYSMAPEQRGEFDLIADSNGCAAGNTREEAILQGFFELAERDAFAIWWYNRLQAPEVDLSSFNDEYLASAAEYYARYERDLWVLDVSSDIGIPAFVALSRRPNAETEDIIYGAGAHADPKIAAQRAICELNQCLTWLPRPGKADGKPMIDDPLALWWWKTARLADCPWLAPAGAPMRKARDYPMIESADARDDVEYCRGLVESKRMELLVLDQTRSDIGMPVVRVIVPGMRHFWERLAPGRLYDVPVDMGLRESPLAEAELNPTPVIA